MSAPPTPAAPPPAVMAAYFAGAVVCQAKGGPETCHLWLDPDGRYQVFYNLGPSAPKPMGAEGPFQLEGREGRYTLAPAGSAAGGGWRLCLTPAPAEGWSYAMQARSLLFGTAGCTAFTPHAAGDSWTQTDAAGRPYTLWLLEGR